MLARGHETCIEKTATSRTCSQWHYSPQVRNLNYLNRDLDKVLLITANPDAHALQPDNAVKVRNVCIPPWPWHLLFPLALAKLTWLTVAWDTGQPSTVDATPYAEVLHATMIALKMSVSRLTPGELRVQLKPWKLESGDTALLDLIPLLEQVFRTNVPDVRAVVRSFEGQDIPSAFRERMLKANQKASERRGLFGSLRR